MKRSSINDGTPPGVSGRVARWLNRGHYAPEKPDLYIRLAGGKLLGSIGCSSRIRYYGFGDKGNLELLWDIDGYFLSGEQASKILAKSVG